MADNVPTNEAKKANEEPPTEGRTSQVRERISERKISIVEPSEIQKTPEATQPSSKRTTIQSADFEVPRISIHSEELLHSDENRGSTQQNIDLPQLESKTTYDKTTLPTTIHYLSPMSPLSVRTREEGEIFEDYMRFLIEPFEKISLAELSSISSSYISCIEPDLQRTIVIVKPDAMIYKDAVLRAIFEAGFQIVGSRVLHLTPEQVSEIYAKHYGSASFPHLVVTVSTAPVLVISIAALNVISKWKEITGPDGSLREDWFYPVSMRVRFGLQKTIPNVLHGSENLKDSNRENRYLYPESILEPLITEEAKVYDYCDLYINKTLTDGLTEVVKKKPIDPILFLADWLLMNNPFQPRMPYKIALTAT